ncbi:MAG: hypothetical protein WDN04_07145 [Rhodospirillales bacterium]
MAAPAPDEIAEAGGWADELDFSGAALIEAAVGLADHYRDAPGHPADQAQRNAEAATPAR